MNATPANPCGASEYIGKTVSDDEMGRGVIIDETPQTVGVRFRRERRKMIVHYIPKRYLEAQR